MTTSWIPPQAKTLAAMALVGVVGTIGSAFAGTEIGTEFPFESKYVEILGSNIHYIDEGEGDPILFLHGNPTSMYLWRNIIPYVSDDARVVAFDLIGMGKSDKPDIDYTFEDHARYLDAFIEELDLKNITLVVHDWGSGLGLNYAANNENNIKGIAMMEALLMPIETKDMSEQRRNRFLNRMATMDAFRESAITDNSIVESISRRVVREMTETEMDAYREPFQTPESRELTFVWVTQIPVDGKPENVFNIVTAYNNWLQETEIPKLLLYVSPGAIVTADVVEWSVANMKNLEVVDLGEGRHFVQEDHPDEIGEAISDWYGNIQ